MVYKMLHNCIKVRDLQRSLKFYAKALHLYEKRRVQCGRVTLVYLGDDRCIRQKYVQGRKIFG